MATTQATKGGRNIAARHAPMDTLMKHAKMSSFFVTLLSLAFSGSLFLDPANYHSGRNYRPRPNGGNIHVDVKAQRPVTIFLTGTLSSLAGSQLKLSAQYLSVPTASSSERGKKRCDDVIGIWPLSMSTGTPKIGLRSSRTTPGFLTLLWGSFTLTVSK
jgi:hypothetical protein